MTLTMTMEDERIIELSFSNRSLDLLPRLAARPPLLPLRQDFVALNFAFTVENRFVTHDRDRSRNRFNDAQQLIAHRIFVPGETALAAT